MTKINKLGKRVLVIPDVHLKPGIFTRADKILESGQADFAISLGDIVDDWGEQDNVGLYRRTLEKAIWFHQKHPDTLWCWGNHDWGYDHPFYGKRQSGHSALAEGDIAALYDEMDKAGINRQFMHIVDDCVFSHAGLSADWEAYLEFNECADAEYRGDRSTVIGLVNLASPEDLWQENSILWWRPQEEESPNVWAPGMLQVVGHTPVVTPNERNNILSTDTFSTYANGAPFGNRRFVVVQTKDKTWQVAEEDEYDYGKVN